VGFAQCAKDRFNDYSAERSMNWFSYLVLSVCRYLFGSKYNFAEYVLCFLKDRDECRVAGELFTTIGRAYIQTGWGLSVAQAGLNVHLVDTDGVTVEQGKELWAKAIQFRNRAYFEHNMANERERLSLYEEFAQARLAAQGIVSVLQQAAKKRDETLARLRAEIKKIKEESLTRKELRGAFNKLCVQMNGTEEAWGPADGRLANFVRQRNEDTRAKVGKELALRRGP
jgi:hypothetical protein